jgi:hypothetical protein
MAGRIVLLIARDLWPMLDKIKKHREASTATMITNSEIAARAD